MPPDALAVAVAYLDGHEDIGGAGVTVGVGTPDSLEGPWVDVALIHAASTDGGITNHHIAAYLQFDCYAGEDDNDSTIAGGLAATVVEALRVANTATHEDAVVTGAESSWHHAPDTTRADPPLERFIVESIVWMRSA